MLWVGDAKVRMQTATLIVVAFALIGCGEGKPTATDTVSFEHVIVDRSGPMDPWGKSVGDINGDGRLDLVVGGHDDGGLAWYENPHWRKRFIADEGSFGTDHEIADIDRDGHNDVVSLMEDRLVWNRQAGDKWITKEIDRRRLHDVEVADLDNDGLLDIVARGQSAFGSAGNELHLYFQVAPGKWERRGIVVPHGEGLILQDIDANGRPDIVINSQWLANPGRRDQEWRSHKFTRSWTWPHAYIAVGDVNGDGRLDIAMSPAEEAGSRYRMSWFEAPPDRTQEWIEHVIDSDVEAVRHFVGIADFDMDGRADVASAMMHQGGAPNEVTVYFGQDGGRNWSQQVLTTKGSHSMQIADVDNDGDPDLFGANWGGEYQQPELWINGTCTPGMHCPCWRRYEIDSARPGRAVFIHAADLDGDRFLDVVTGSWWYRNPGTTAGTWERNTFGVPGLDVALLADLDRDGDVDVLGTEWREQEAHTQFVFAENDGHGSFRLRADLPVSAGDFLQGVALAQFGDKGKMQVALSWHAPGRGIQLLTVPNDPESDVWRLERITDASQDEALSAGDIDQDGRIDLLLGTRWLRNEGEGRWTLHSIDAERDNPDRNRLADINGDSRLDAVVGFEAISVSGDVAWYEQGPDSRASWNRNLIGSVIGPMSLDVADFDSDGDLDVVVGEHNLEKPQTARLVLFDNLDGRGTDWREHVVHTGDEHHDGALAADVDGDGDPDVLSIGWGHGKVTMFENRTNACR